MIPDRLFYPLAAVVAAALIGLAFVWPQGQGAPSPGPFRVAAPAQNSAVQSAPAQAAVKAVRK